MNCDIRAHITNHSCKLGTKGCILEHEGDLASPALFDGIVLDNLEHQSKICKEVHLERQKQDQQWGGPKHDDEHTFQDWAYFISKQYSALFEERNGIGIRHRLIKIAALALAAVESFDRKAGDLNG